MTTRFSPSRFALSYIALGVLALALFAIPLWYGYRANLGTFRAYVPGAEMQRLVELFHRDGAQAVAAAIDSYLPSLPSDEVMIFVDPQKRRLAGNLPAWPAEVPDVPGTYGMVIGLGGEASMRVVTSHVTLPGGYYLLMGRESVRFQSLVERFWYGIFGAMALVLALGGLIAWRSREALVAERTAQLRESEQRYALVMDASEDGFWDWKVATDEFYASPRLVELYGFPADTKFASRAEFLQRFPFHPEDRPKWEQAVAAHFAGQTARFDIEIRMLRGGETHWLHLTGLATRNAAGEVSRWTGASRDVTERKLAEAELHVSRERYARAMEASNDGLWEWNPATDEMFVSSRARQLFAIPEAAEIRTRADVKAHGGFHPEDRDRIEATIQACLAQKSAGFEMEYRVIAPSGEVRWISSQGKGFSGADGTPALLTGSLTDITERKCAELALADSEARFRSLTALSSDFFWETDPEHRYISIEFGKAYRGARNRPPKLGKARWEIPYLAPDEAAWAAHRAAIAARERFVDFGFLRDEGGELRYYEHSGEPRYDAQGRFLGYRGIGRDVTERKRAEEALRLSEERYALAMQASGEGHWDWKIATDEFYASPRWREISGFPLDAKFGGRAEMLACYPFHPEDRPKYEAAVAAHFAGKTPRLDMALRITPRGGLRWVKFTGMCLRDAAGTPVRWAGSIMDITEQKRAEEALRESEKRYARAMEGSDAGHWDWNIVTDEMFVSERAREMLALPAGPLPARRADLMVLVPQHPDDETRMNEYVSSGIRSGSHERDYRVIPPSGEVRWLHSRAKVYKDARGAAVRMTGSLIDITERKLAADALRASEERYSLAMEAAEEGHFDWDVRTDKIFVSVHIRKVLDLPLDMALGTSAELDARIPRHPDDRIMLAEMARKVLASSVLRHEFEYRILREGEVRWVRARWKIFRDAAGAAQRVIGVVTDVTERKRAADELRASEARFRSLTELSSDWYWRQDENLRFTYLSGQVHDLTGYSGDSSLGKTRWEIASMTPLSCSWAEHQAVLAARQPFRDLECRRVGPDGTVRYLSMSGAPIFDEQGRFRGYQGIGRNITERKRIEEELRARQEMLDLAQKSAQAIAFEWRIGADGPDQNHWSPELAAMYGVRPESYDGSLEQWKKHVHPEDWPAVKEAIKHAQRTGEVSSEYRAVHPDGSVHWLQAKGRMFFDAEGKPARMVGFMHDVTERRRAEGEVKRMERQLRQAQRLEAMGTLAGGIAHDFNNILGAILGYGEMALRDAAKGSRLRRDLDSIMTAGERGRALVDRVLAFSRSGVGERVAVHVEKVVREALDLISAKLPPNVTLHAKLHAGSAAMLGDPTQVHQVLMNLATNAIQAMPGGGTLRVSLAVERTDATRAATIGTLAAADYVVLKVADTGTGIAPEIIERIFDPFFTTKEVGTGTGLGLSLVHGIVAELGGAIDVASTPGAGSTFTVYLPRSGEALDSSQEEEAELPRGDGQRVLVVDDEAPLVKLATRTLEELGYAPIGFTSSTAALAAFRANPQRFDAVITDERMPGMSGSALIREVRGIRGRIPIVLMSGFVGGAVASRAREAGAEEVLKKPLSARDLAASLARVLHP